MIFVLKTAYSLHRPAPFFGENNRHQRYFSTLEDQATADNPASFYAPLNGTGRDAFMDKLGAVKMPIAIGINRLVAKGKNIPMAIGTSGYCSFPHVGVPFFYAVACSCLQRRKVCSASKHHPK